MGVGRQSHHPQPGAALRRLGRGVEDFAPLLWQLAVQRQIPYAGEAAVTADGAAWIWRVSADLFPCSTQIVDWYHAAQQAAALAQARFPDDPVAAQHWSDTLKHHLWQGECWRAIVEAQAAGLAANYFVDHQRRMDYPPTVRRAVRWVPVRLKAVSSSTSSGFVGLGCAGHDWG